MNWMNTLNTAVLFAVHHFVKGSQQSYLDTKSKCIRSSACYNAVSPPGVREGAAEAGSGPWMQLHHRFCHVSTSGSELTETFNKCSIFS